MVGLAVDQNGNTYASGETGTDGLIVRFLQNGKFDQSFGNGGVITRLSQGAAAVDSTRFITFPAPGKVLVAGTIGDSELQFEAQYTSNGKLDPSFGSGGIAENTNLQRLGAAATTPDGKLLLAGDGAVARIYEATPAVVISGVRDGVEGGTVGEFTFSRDQAYDFSTRIYYQTSGTAKPTTDYTGQLAPTIGNAQQGGSSFVQFVDIPAGQTTVSVTVHVAARIGSHSVKSLTVSAIAGPSYVTTSASTGEIFLLGDQVVPATAQQMTSRTALLGDV
jgi:hypothetical protein